MKIINCNFHLDDLECFEGKGFTLPPNETFNVKIDYPVDGKHLFPFNTGKKGMGFIGVLSQIYKAYVKVYSNEKKYGIWGHSMGDLFVEGINIDLETKTISMSIGS